MIEKNKKLLDKDFWVSIIMVKDERKGGIKDVDSNNRL